MNKNKSQLRLGALMSYANMAIGALIPMFYTPIMLSFLGNDEYGLYKLASSVTGYLSLISFGIGSAIIRYLTKFRAEKDKEGEENMLGLFNVIFLVIAGITVVLGLVISFNIGFVYSDSLESEQVARMQILLIILTINTAITFTASPYSAVVNCHERFVFLQFINILLTVVVPIANIVAMYMGFASIGLVVSTLAINIVVRIIYIFYVKHSIGIKAKYNKMPTYLIKELLVFSFWVFVANVVSQLYNTTDTLIIGAIPALATTGVAIYNIGTTFNSMMLNFAVGITSVMSTKVNMMVFGKKSNEELTELLIRIGRLQCYIVGIVCSGFIAFGHQFIHLWVGNDFQDAYWIALVTMIPACVPLIQSVALSIIIAQNKHRFRSLVYLAIAIANVVGTILCVNQFGIIGAAVVTGVANIIGQGIVMNWYYWKKIGLNIPKFWKSAINTFIIPVLLCVISLILFSFIDLSNWALFFISVIIFALLFVVLSWIFVMTDYEKDIVRVPLMKIVNKFKRKA